MANHDFEDGTLTRTRAEEELKEPPLYRVILHNDDYTPMEFVVIVLTEVFQHGAQSAQSLMMRVHIAGHGVVGIYPFEIAESKVMKATRIAQEHGFPLLLTLEENS